MAALTLLLLCITLSLVKFWRRLMRLSAFVLCVSDSNLVYCVLPERVCVVFKLTHAFDAFWIHVCLYCWGIASVLERSAGCRLKMDSGVRDGLSVPVDHKRQDCSVLINQSLPSDRSLCTHWRVADLIVLFCRENWRWLQSTARSVHISYCRN